MVRLGYPPSFDDVRKAFDFKKYSVVKRIFERLEAYGYLEVDKGIARGIRLHNTPPVEDLGAARLKAQLSEVCGILHRMAPDDPEVQSVIKRCLPFVF
jgi:SOS-response transcriptional repressor LexA